MSVLINMEMPTSCADCPLGDSLHCQVLPSVPALWAEYTNAIREKRLHSDCPLVPVPLHGDLIDRRYAIATACSGRIRTLPTTEDGENWIRVEEVRESIKNAPTIIPEEEGE